MSKKSFTLLLVIAIILLNIIIIIISATFLDFTYSNNTNINTNSNIKSNVNHTIEYGIQQKAGRVPLVMLRSKLDQEVHERFLQYSMFSCNEIDLNSFHGLENRVKHPIYIYEGYYHSLVTKDTVYSRNPNPKIAIDFDKPAADTFIRAYYEAFRRINTNTFNKLKNELISSAITRVPNNPESDICYGFTKWIDKSYIAGDLSIQIHYGKGNDETFKNAWHTDALNSLLHFAITIKGNRVLHSFRSNSSNSIPIEILETQEPGSIYLSSSTLMKHAPKFSNTNYDTRVIAIHARILYTTEEMKSFTSNITDSGWYSLTSIIANTLATSNIIYPNIHQVNDVYNDIT
jgi:hypothetical protein